MTFSFNPGELPPPTSRIARCVKRVFERPNVAPHEDFNKLLLM